MATVTEQTDSQILEQLLSLSTLALTSDEWLKPEPQINSKESTETSMSGEGADTSAKSPASFTPPVRKSAYRLELSGTRFEVLQQWECVVLEVRDDCVYCKMHDLTDEPHPEEFAEVLISEFHEYDRSILLEGTVFYWSVGYIHRSNGEISRSSQLRVRRMPALTTSKRAEISMRVRNLRSATHLS